MLVAAVAAVLPATTASGDAGAWDLAHPSLVPATTNLIGEAPRGVVVDVVESTTASVLGITASFGAPTTLTVEVRTMTGASFGDVVASGSLGVPGGGPVDFHDVPLTSRLTFVAGQRYDIRFQIPGGWGEGPNRIEFQKFDNRQLVTERAFRVGPFTVVDGFGGSLYTPDTSALPHVRVLDRPVDAEPPTIEVAAAPGDDVTDGGWYNAASSGTDGVALEVVASDASGVRELRCTDNGRVVLDEADRSAAVLVVSDGLHSVRCTAVDGHGNVGSTASAFVALVDQTAPALAPQVKPNPVFEGQAAEAVPAASDAIGVADAWCGDVATRIPGRHTVPCYADDLAGNRSSAVAEYDVLYAFDGFFAPVGMGVVNRAKAGSSVPLKFSLDGFHGADVLAAGSPSVQRCDGEGGAQPARGQLSYDGDDDVYVYVWKTDRAWSGGCYDVTVRLDDGGAKSVRFSMT